jgi:hypothetical protein
VRDKNNGWKESHMPGVQAQVPYAVFGEIVVGLVEVEGEPVPTLERYEQDKRVDTEPREGEHWLGIGPGLVIVKRDHNARGFRRLFLGRSALFRLQLWEAEQAFKRGSS